MGRGKRLDSSEIKVINNLKDTSSISQISKIIKRSRHVVRNYLRNPENYGKKNPGGRPRAISERDQRSILRIASNSMLTSREIAANAGVNTKVRNVQRLLQKAKHLKRKKLKAKPPLTQEHKERRLQFAEGHLNWKKRWRKVIFSDEKRFNLDGLDGFRYYFHDLRKDNIVLSKRHSGGGGIMVWAGIGYYGRTEIKFISGRMNSRDYIKIIDEQLSKYATSIAAPNYVFQHDNSAVHTAKCVKDFFASKEIEVLNWPARSPDINIIENCWGQLSRKVYSSGKQFHSIEDLKLVIKDEWEKLEDGYIKTLFKSLPARMREIFKSKGSQTHY